MREKSVNVTPVDTNILVGVCVWTALGDFGRLLEIKGDTRNFKIGQKSCKPNTKDLSREAELSLCTKVAKNENQNKTKPKQEIKKLKTKHT